MLEVRLARLVHPRGRPVLEVRKHGRLPQLAPLRTRPVLQVRQCGEGARSGQEVRREEGKALFSGGMEWVRVRRGGVR